MKTQSGRSMVEMLGVLAIIGVLSVGAIAGYSKAMMKYKLNKHAEQMNQIMAAISRHTGSFKNLQGESFIEDAFILMGEIPQEMIVKKDNGRMPDILDVFHNSISIQYYPKTSSLSGDKLHNRIILVYYLSGTDSNTATEVCRSLFVTAKEQSGELLSIAAGRIGPNPAYLYYGDKYCSNNCIKNLSMNTIGNICANAKSKSSNIRDDDMSGEMEEYSLSTFGLSIGKADDDISMNSITFAWQAD